MPGNDAKPREKQGENKEKIYIKFPKSDHNYLGLWQRVVLKDGFNNFYQEQKKIAPAALFFVSLSYLSSISEHFCDDENDDRKRFSSLASGDHGFELCDHHFHGRQRFSSLATMVLSCATIIQKIVSQLYFSRKNMLFYFSREKK